MIKGVIFDLDGVLVKTDDMHYRAWSKIARDENIYFDNEINDRLRGVSRYESLNIVLERAKKDYNLQQIKEMAEKKNDLYRKYISELSSLDRLPGVDNLLSVLKEKEMKIAVGSSSKNADYIIGRIGLSQYFDSVITGNEVKKSKPDPEIFNLAAEAMRLKPQECVVVEDAESGIEAAKNAGMKVIGIGSKNALKNADIVISGLEEPGVIDLLLD